MKILVKVMTIEKIGDGYELVVFYKDEILPAGKFDAVLDFTNAIDITE